MLIKFKLDHFCVNQKKPNIIHQNWKPESLAVNMELVEVAESREKQHASYGNFAIPEQHVPLQLKITKKLNLFKDKLNI